MWGLREGERSKWVSGPDLCILTLLWLSFIALLSRVSKAERRTERENSFFSLNFMIDWIFHWDRLVFMPLLLLSFYSPSRSLASGQTVQRLWVAVSSQAQRTRQTVRLLLVSSRHRWRTHSPPLHCSATRRPSLPGRRDNKSQCTSPSTPSVTACQLDVGEV